MKQTHTEVGKKFNLFDLCQFGMMMARVVISEEKGSPVDILKNLRDIRDDKMLYSGNRGFPGRTLQMVMQPTYRKTRNPREDRTVTTMQDKMTG